MQPIRSRSSRSKLALLLSMIAIVLTSVQPASQPTKAAQVDDCLIAPIQPQDTTQTKISSQVDCEPLQRDTTTAYDWYPSQFHRLYGTDTTSNTGLGNSFALDEASNTLIVAASSRDGGRGGFYVYSWINNDWVEQAAITPADAVVGDQVASRRETLAIQGDTLIVGAPFQANSLGAVYIYTRSGGTWTQAGKITGTVPNGYFGRSVNLLGNTLIISAPQENNYQGAVYIYTGSGGTWTQQARLTPNDPVNNGQFGLGLASENNTLVIGRPFWNNVNNDGAAYVFSRNGNTWTQTAKLTAPNSTFGTNYFGFQVAISNCNIIVTAQYEERFAGAVYSFTSNNCSGWTQSQKLVDSYYSQFGKQISLIGNMLAVTSDWNEFSQFPMIYLYQREGTTWTVSEQFGRFEAGFVQLGNSHLLLGLPRINEGGIFQPYRKNGTQWVALPEKHASDATTPSYFGSSLDMNNNTLIVGAPHFDGSKGAAYIYTYANDAWGFQSKLLPSNPDTDEFGTMVQVSGDYALVAYGAWNISEGVEVFKRTGTTWIPSAIVNPVLTGLYSIEHMSLHSNTLVLHVRDEQEQRRFHFFQRNGDTWTQTQVLNAPVDVWSLDVYGGTLAVVDSDNRREIQIYVRNGGTWSFETALTISNSSMSVQSNVALDVNRVMVTYKGSGNPTTVYSFKRTLSGWIEEQQITAIDDNYYPGFYAFAENIALQGNRAIFTRPNGDRAYLFVLGSNGKWEQQRVYSLPYFSFYNTSFALRPVVLSTTGIAAVANYESIAGRGEVITFDTFQKGARRDTIGIYRQSNNTFYLKQSNTTGNADFTIPFGYACGGNTTCSYPVVGDWNSDGIDTIGIYDRTTGVFKLRNTNTSGAPDITLTLGNPGDTPLAGRWATEMTGDGIGVFRPTNGIIYLKKQLTSGFSDFYAVMGNPSDVGIAGDWDGDMIDNIGIYRPNEAQFYLSYAREPAGITFADTSVILGNADDFPVVGDWEGLGRSGLGVFRPTTGQIYMKNYISSGFADKYLIYGVAGDIPVAGRWTAPLAPPPISSPNILIGVPNVSNGDTTDENAD